MNRESFSDWALSPERTLEERFGAQWLIEQVCGLPIPKYENWSDRFEAEREYRRERQLNPAYEPTYTEATAREAEEKLPTLKAIQSTSGDDRLVRDLSWMRFCPAVEEGNLPNTEARDWSPIVHWKRVKTLWVKDHIAWEFGPIGSLATLETLRLFLHAPWPDLSSFGQLRALKELHFYGNPLALAGIGELPQVREADLNHWLSFTVPLRGIHDLPAMPELRKLKLINTWRLEGIERYTQLINAEIYGYFDDLSPLAALGELTHLTLSGGSYDTLSPLVGLPKLHYLLVRNERPQEYSPLAEMTCLHEVATELCPASVLEVASLNAGLPPWSALFAAREPRPLGALRLVLDRKDEEPPDDLRPEKRDWGENEEMAHCEARWFAREINRRLRAVLGKGWGKCNEKYARHPGHEHVEIKRMKDVDHLVEVVRALRELLCACRYPWRCSLLVEPLRQYERDMEEIEDDDDDDDDEEFDAERERQDFEYRQQRAKERRDFLERQHRLRLQQELGAPIKPEDFAAPKEDEDEDEKMTAGGVEDTQPEYDLGTNLRLYLMVMERGCFVPEHCRELAELLLEMKAEEPPEKESPPDAPAP